MQQNLIADKHQIHTALAMSRKRPQASPASPGAADPNDPTRKQRLVNDLLTQERLEKKEKQRQSSIERQKEHKMRVVSKILNSFSRKQHEDKRMEQRQSDYYHGFVKREEEFRPRTTSHVNRAHFKTEKRPERNINERIIP